MNNIYDVQNINHCTIEEIGNPIIFYRITSNEDWCIHRSEENEETNHVWKTVTMLRADEDPSIIQVMKKEDVLKLTYTKKTISEDGEEVVEIINAEIC